MTDDQNLLDRLTDDSTRRSVLKKGALATAGAGLAGISTGGAAAQVEDDGVVDDQEWDKGIISTGQFQPRGRFIITSPVLRWNPRVEEIRDNVWSEYNTRLIRYLNTNDIVPFWQAHEAEVPDFNEQAGYVVDDEGDTFQDGTVQPEVFRMNADASLFGDSGYLTVQFTPVGEDEEEALFDDEGVFFEDDVDGSPVGLDDV